MDSPVEPEEHTLESLGRIVLECSCGERLVLLGLEEDWRSEQRTEFECSCGKGLTLLINRLNEDVLEFRRHMRGPAKSRAVDIGGLCSGEGARCPSRGNPASHENKKRGRRRRGCIRPQEVDVPSSIATRC